MRSATVGEVGMGVDSENGADFCGYEHGTNGRGLSAALSA